MDRRNNSAWNQRWFVVATHELPKCKVSVVLVNAREADRRNPGVSNPVRTRCVPHQEGSAEEAAVGAREVAFAMGHIEGSGDLGNESPWHYLRGCVLCCGCCGCCCCA